MTVLKSLVVYWLKDGGKDNFLVPPLEDILNPKLQPPPQWYPAYVNLFAASLQRENGVVGINMPDTISTPRFCACRACSCSPSASRWRTA